MSLITDMPAFMKRAVRLFVTFVAIAAPFAVSAAATATVIVDTNFTREKLLLVALFVSAFALLAALLSIAFTHRRFRRHLEQHRDQLRRAFADAYVGMRDSSVEAKKVRDAERAIERIITDLENFV